MTSVLRRDGADSTLAEAMGGALRGAFQRREQVLGLDDLTWAGPAGA